MSKTTTFPTIEDVPITSDISLLGSQSDVSLAEGQVGVFHKEFTGDIYTSRGRFGNGTNYVDISATRMQSANFVSGTSGWQIQYSGDVEFNNGTFRGDISAATGTFSGGIAIGISPNWFKVDTSGNMWLGGATLATATCSITNAGALTATSATVSGAITTGAGSTINGTYVDALSVIKLTSGSISSKQITLAVAAGTGDSYIAAGKTDFDNTTPGFILGLDDSDSDTAKFCIGSSTQFLNWTGAALDIAGNITLDTAGHIKAGQTAYNTGIGFWLGNDSGTYKFSIGDPTGDYLLWDGSNLSINFLEQFFTYFFNTGPDGTVNVSSGSFSSGPITSNALTRDALFENLTLSGGNLNVAGYGLFVKNTLTIDSGYKIFANGNTGGNASTSTAGTGGAAGTSGSLPQVPAGGAGGNGNISGQGNNAPAPDGLTTVIGEDVGVAGGGSGDNETTGAAVNGTGVSDNMKKVMLSILNLYTTRITGASWNIAQTATGGGGGYGNSSNWGGGGGGAGSAGQVAFIVCNTLTLTGTIEANGGNGGNAAQGTDGSANENGPNGGGGGAGGNGGIVIILCQTLDDQTGGVITSNGGNGGNGGDGGNNNSTLAAGSGGSGGSGGNGGYLIIFYTSRTADGTLSVNAGSGGAAGLKGENAGAGADGNNGSAGSSGSGGTSIIMY